MGAIGKILIKQGADTTIVGCTKISLVLKHKNALFLVIGSVKIIAMGAVQIALVYENTAKLLQSIKIWVKKVSKTTTKPKKQEMGSK